MILPGSYALTLTILILAMLAAGSWANTFKMTGPKWRFELFYIDFAVGVLVAGLLIGFTFGSMGWDGFSVMDDLHLAGKRQELFAFLAGCVFNLGGLLLIGAMSIAGIAIAFLVAMGTAFMTAVLIGIATGAVGSPLLPGAGCLVVLVSVIFAAIAYRDLAKARLAAAPEPGKKPSRKSFSFKAIILALLSGIFLGSFFQLIDMSKGENGLGPYSAGLVFAVGVFMSTLVFNLFFMNLPVQGKPVEIGEYFRGRTVQHLLGVIGGFLLAAALIANLVADRAEGPARVDVALKFALNHAGTILAAFWGLIVWKELDGAEGRARTLLGATLFLFVLAVAILSFAPSNTLH